MKIRTEKQLEDWSFSVDGEQSTIIIKEEIEDREASIQVIEEENDEKEILKEEENLGDIGEENFGENKEEEGEEEDITQTSFFEKDTSCTTECKVKQCQDRIHILEVYLILIIF
jgi:hypothetical protein